MADNEETKGATPANVSADTKDAPVHPTKQPAWDPSTGPIPRPAGWMYKGVKLGKTELWYASPKVQLFLVSMVCFLCPGMFNAITGMGGGGQVSTQAQNDASTALYRYVFRRMIAVDSSRSP